MSIGQRIGEGAMRIAFRATVKQIEGRPASSFRAQRVVNRALFLSTIAPKGIVGEDAAGAPVPTDRVLPSGARSERTILYLHGGGYVVGSARSYRAFTGRLALAAGAEVVAPEYRLAPEHPFPAARDDAIATYEWILEQGAEPSAVAIAGDSAGGGLTIATALAIRDAELPLPGALYVNAPWLDLTLSSETIASKRRADPILRTAWLRQAATAYAAGTPKTDPGVSPLFADFAGLPPTLIQVGSEEVLLAEAGQLAERMRDAGIDVELTVYDGLWHDFQLQAPVLRRATEALEAAGEFIRSYT